MSKAFGTEAVLEVGGDRSASKVDPGQASVLNLYCIYFE